MPLTVAPRVDVNALSNLRDGKLYFLSSTTGQVKEASIWMRFKCAIGVQSARQKVANLVDAVRTSLLESAGQKTDATLEKNIKDVDLTSMVRGSVIKDIVGRFSAANSAKMMQGEARKIASGVAKTIAVQLNTFHLGLGKQDAVAKIVEHALKPMTTGDLPTITDNNGRVKLNVDQLRTDMLEAAKEIGDTIQAAGGKAGKAGGALQIDKHYAKHIIDTLYNADGTRNDASLDELKPKSKVLTEVAFRLGENLLGDSANAKYESLKEAGIDVEKSVCDILDLCGHDDDLRDIVMDVLPDICANSNYEMRSMDKIKAKVAALKDSLDEIRTLEKDFPGAKETLKTALTGMGGVPFPKGMLTQIANSVKTAKLDTFKSINSLSSPDTLYKALEELRTAANTVIKSMDLDARFLEVGEEEVGAPHAHACRLAAVAFATAIAGPALKARLPSVINSNSFNTMNAYMDEMQSNLKFYVENGKSSAAGDVLEEQMFFSDFMRTAAGLTGTEADPVDNIDIESIEFSKMVTTLEEAL